VKIEYMNITVWFVITILVTAVIIALDNTCNGTNLWLPCAVPARTCPRDAEFPVKVNGVNTLA